MDRAALENTAKQMVAPGKGILAADESTGTITKRLKTINTESTETTRRDYRETLFSTDNLDQWISGVILYDETLRQEGANGIKLADAMTDQGILPGIKVDTGAKDLANHPGEKVTEGLDGLRERLTEYYALGARFAKWRAVITIGDDIPSRACIEANAHALARYASLCQEAGIVPIVEPEVLMDGDHDIDRCETVTGETWREVFDQLHRQDVHLPGIVLKPSMVISGKDCKTRAGVDEVARRTVDLLKKHVPSAVPGIAFLSGGQTPEEATAHLNTMNKTTDLPWRLTFSYGRALQEPALAAWAGENANRDKAQAALAARAQANSEASLGKHEERMKATA